MSHERGPGGFGSDDTGVSPVIGVVLMVAIVVILAAVVGAFAFGFGEKADNTTPSFSSKVTYEQATADPGQSLTVDVKAGNEIDVSTLTIKVQGAEFAGSGTRKKVEYSGNALSSVGSTLKAGDTFTIDETDFQTVAGGNAAGSSEYLDLSDANVRIVWKEEPSSGSSSIIFRWQPENA